MKRVLASILVFLMVTVGVIYAGGKQEEFSGKKQIVTMWQQPIDYQIEFSERMANLTIAEKYPNLKLVGTYIPDSEYKTKGLVALSSGTRPDIMDTGSPHFQVWRDYLSPVDLKVFNRSSYQEFTKDWLPGSLDAYTMNGICYAIPREQGVHNIYVNTAHFKEAGLDWEKDYPKTWEDQQNRRTPYDTSH